MQILRNYLTNFINWKSGGFFLQNAQQLGNRVQNIAQNFGVKFNPRVTQEKIDQLTRAREQLSDLRFQLWQLPGHKLVLKLDFSLSQADDFAQRTIGTLWESNNKEIETKESERIIKDLNVVSLNIKQIAPSLREAGQNPKQYFSDYEREYLEGINNEAKRFKEKLAKIRLGRIRYPIKEKIDMRDISKGLLVQVSLAITV
jgi:hypothetical protein